MQICVATIVDRCNFDQVLERKAFGAAQSERDFGYSQSWQSPWQRAEQWAEKRCQELLDNHKEPDVFDPEGSFLVMELV